MTGYAVLETAAPDERPLVELRLSGQRSANQPDLSRLQVPVRLISPTGVAYQADAFWAGGDRWVARFQPAQTGTWTFEVGPFDDEEGGDGVGAARTTRGTFDWQGTHAPRGQGRRGPLTVQGSHVRHADGTPFLWIADTAWNIALLGTEAEWIHYLTVRAAQGFTVVQIVTTQWLGAPTGDREGRVLFDAGVEPAIDLQAVERVERFIELANRHGFLVAPVMLWAAQWGDPQAMSVNPGVSLSVPEAVSLGRYLLARWGALDVAWILAGDGIYDTPEAVERWTAIGRGIFGPGVERPVAMHPAGQTWFGPALQEQPWLSVLGYQSGHWGDAASLAWIAAGQQVRPESQAGATTVINLEPCYEGMRALASGKTLDANDVRRATWLSLLSGPIAGVSYGCQGVWGWDDSEQPTPGHEVFGPTQPWRKALTSPGADQIGHLHRLLTALDWWALRPLADHRMAVQPGATVAASASPTTAVVYVDGQPSVALSHRSLPACTDAIWFDPRNGRRRPTRGVEESSVVVFALPEEADWVLIVGAAATDLAGAQG